jgi:hypothetical protein
MDRVRKRFAQIYNNIHGFVQITASFNKKRHEQLVHHQLAC